MLNYLRQHVASALAQANSATLATNGPAGLQANQFACAASGTRLYVLVPSTSDHLLNLESNSTVVVTTANWHVRGTARVLKVAEYPGIFTLPDSPGAPWSVVVEVSPARVEIAHAKGWGAAETIDFE